MQIELKLPSPQTLLLAASPCSLERAASPCSLERAASFCTPQLPNRISAIVDIEDVDPLLPPSALLSTADREMRTSSAQMMNPTAADAAA